MGRRQPGPEKSQSPSQRSAGQARAVLRFNGFPDLAGKPVPIEVPVKRFPVDHLHFLEAFVRPFLKVPQDSDRARDIIQRDIRDPRVTDVASLRRTHRDKPPGHGLENCRRIAVRFAYGDHKIMLGDYPLGRFMREIQVAQRIQPRNRAPCATPQPGNRRLSHSSCDSAQITSVLEP